MEKSDYYQRALAAIDLKRWDLALKELTGVLSISPQEARAFSLMSVCSFNLGQIDRAIEHAKKAIKHDPEWTNAYYLLALAQTSKGRFKDAETAIESALARDPQCPDYLVVKANLCFVEMQWKRGLELLEQGLAQQPEHASCLRLKAYGLRKLGKVAEADQVVKCALSLHPEDARLYAEAGWSAIRSDAGAAQEHFEEALRLDPSDESYIRAVKEARYQNRWFFKLFRKFTNRWIMGPYYLLWLIFSRRIEPEWAALWLYGPLLYLIVCGLITAVWDGATGMCKRTYARLSARNDHSHK